MKPVKCWPYASIKIHYISEAREIMGKVKGSKIRFFLKVQDSRC